jgi:peptidoglycan/LPS O-acetylase OafA/YrhL
LARVFDVPVKPGHIPSIQGLRGVAASLVFLVHFLSLFGDRLGVGSGDVAERVILLAARTGTDLFLLISGFLVYGMCIRNPLDFGRFFRSRIRRLYPAFLVVFGLYLIASAVFPAESKIPAEPAAAGLYLAENLALLPGLTGTPALITVTWTLGYELALYLTVPLAVRFFGLREWPSRQRAAFLVTVWVGYLAYCGVCAPGHGRVGVLLTAFLVYELVRGGGRISLRRELAALTLVATGIGFLVLFRMGTIPAPARPGHAIVLRVIASSALLFAVAGCCFAGRGLCSRVLSATPMWWLGNISYSFFLIHGLVLKGVAHLGHVLHVPDPVLGWAALPLGYLGSLAAATVLFVTIEQRWVERKTC